MYANDIAAKNRDIIVSLVELIVALFFSRNLTKLDKRNGLFILLMVLSTIIGFTGFSQPQVKRIAYYFATPAECILYGYLPFCTSRSSQTLTKAVVILFFSSIFIITYYILGQSHILPYNFDIKIPWYSY